MQVSDFTARSRRTALAALACLALLAAGAARADAPAETLPNRVRIDTNLGSFVIQLENQRAPLTVANFLSYVKTGYYTGTVFHRVISNFVIQGGGYDEKFALKETHAPVPNESGSGLSNKRGTVGLARAEPPHSGNAQFYVNLTDNDELDPTPLRWGYAVFGRVVEGMDVVDRIGHTPTGSAGPFPKDVPVDAVVIKHVEAITLSGAPITFAAPAAPPAPPPAPPK